MILHPGSDSSPDSKHKACAKVSRQFALLRAHGLIYKVPKTHLWRMTQKGKTAMAMVSKLRHSNLSDLKIAA